MSITIESTTIDNFVCYCPFHYVIQLMFFSTINLMKLFFCAIEFFKMLYIWI
jgi:hypothetical protein